MRQAPGAVCVAVRLAGSLTCCLLLALSVCQLFGFGVSSDFVSVRATILRCVIDCAADRFHSLVLELFFLLLVIMINNAACKDDC